MRYTAPGSRGNFSQMRFTKVTLLTINILLLAISLYWTTRSWITQIPSYSARSCTILSKRIKKSRSLFRTEFFVSLKLHTGDPVPKPPVIAFRYASAAFNQTLLQARGFVSRFEIGKNYTCFVNSPRKGVSTWRYSIAMTYPSESSHVWVATLFTCVVLLALLLQLAFIGNVEVTAVAVVTPPPRVGLSNERVQEICEECSVDECAICLEEDDAKGARLPCGHSFHKLCLERWLVKGRVCPLCNCDLMIAVKNSGKTPEARVVTVRTGSAEMEEEVGVRRRKSEHRDSVQLD